MRGWSKASWILPWLLLAAAIASAQSALSPIPEQTTSTAALTSPPPSDEEIGDALALRQRYQAAIAAYAKTQRMTAEIWNKMGIAYQMMFDARDGMRCYRQSLKLEPRNALVWNNLGTVYASLKQYGQAEKIYRKALKYDPHSALILKNLGTNLMAERKFEKGDAVYRQALAIDPHVFTVHASQTVENPGSVKERGAMNYYMSLSCARAGYAECALDYLRKSLNEGFATSKMVAAEGDFASLRDNTDFQQLLAGQRK